MNHPIFKTFFALVFIPMNAGTVLLFTALQKTRHIAKIPA